MSTDPAAFVTEAQFLAMPDDGVRRELFDGELVVSPSAKPSHQRVVRRLAVALDAWCAAHADGREAFVAPLDVATGPHRILEPDVVVFPRRLTDDDWPARVVPLLVVEVLSPTTARYDQVRKREAYAAMGVPEYWLVDPDGTAEVCHGPGLTASVACADRIDSVAYPGLSVRPFDG